MYSLLQVIRTFLCLLNTTEEDSIRLKTKLFASQMTTESLRVTLMSVLDIILLLHDKDVIYVLTAKLNQDPLEVSNCRHHARAVQFTAFAASQFGV